MLLRLPDTLAAWPWPCAVNRHYDVVAAESAAWLRSFCAFPADVQRAFDRCNFGLLASMAFPGLSPEHLRITCDLMNVFFVIEELTDAATPAAVAAVTAAVRDALRHPQAPRPAGECVAGEIARQFWHNAVRSGAAAVAQVRFVEAFERYLAAVVGEAEARARPQHTQHAQQRTTTVSRYLALRRETIGAAPSFALLALPMAGLPAAALDQPVVETLARLATDLILIGNDIVSYAKERVADGATHNIVTAVSQPAGADRPGEPGEPGSPDDPGPDDLDNLDRLGEPAPGDLQAAMDWIARLHADRARRFLALHGSFVRGLDAAWPPPVAAQLRAYVGGLGNWVRANDQWSFEGQRYFADGPAVQTSRVVEVAE